MRLIKEAPFEVELTVLRKGEVEPEAEGQRDYYSIPACHDLSRLRPQYQHRLLNLDTSHVSRCPSSIAPIHPAYPTTGLSAARLE
jgi:hypothetical protein